MMFVWALAFSFVIALTAAAEGASRKKRSAPQPARALPSQAVHEQDEFRFCDVAVREFIQGRREATAVPVKEVKIDVLRMTLNFIHPYGESGDTAPNLSFTRAESVEERRKLLNETKQRLNALADAAKGGNVWYAVGLRKDSQDDTDAKRTHTSANPEDSRSPASAIILASMNNKCVTVYEYKSVSLDRLSDELRRLLGERAREASPAEIPTGKPQS
jgi:hypothetical protein